MKGVFGAQGAGGVVWLPVLVAGVVAVWVSSMVAFAADGGGLPGVGTLWVAVGGLGLTLLVYLVSFVAWCVRLDQKVDGIDKKIEGLDKRMGWLDRRVGGLTERVVRLETMNGIGLIGANSPLSLTEKGADLLHDSGGGEYLDAHRDVLLKEFEDFDNAFDIQEEAKKVIERKVKERGDAGFDSIKRYLFDNAKSANDIILVMGIGLRDMVLDDKGIIWERRMAVVEENPIVADE